MKSDRNESYTLANSYDVEWQLIRVYWTKHVLGGWGTEEQARKVLNLWTEYVLRATSLRAEGGSAARVPPAVWDSGLDGDTAWGIWGGVGFAHPEPSQGTPTPEQERELYWRAQRVVQALGGVAMGVGKRFPDLMGDDDSSNPHPGTIAHLALWLRQAMATTIQYRYHNIPTDPEERSTHFWVTNRWYWELLVSGRYEQVTRIHSLDWAGITPPPINEAIGVPYYMWCIPLEDAQRAFRKVRADLKQRVNTARHRSGKKDLAGTRVELFRALEVIEEVDTGRVPNTATIARLNPPVF